MWLLRGEGMLKPGDGLYPSIVLHDYNVKSQGSVPGKGKNVPLEKRIIGSGFFSVTCASDIHE